MEDLKGWYPADMTDAEKQKQIQKAQERERVFKEQMAKSEGKESDTLVKRMGFDLFK